MENASKALLIAGAILIVIVLISIGMMIVQSSSDITGQVGDIASKQAVQAFNQEYQNYQGDQKGATVRSLLNSIATNNSSNSSGHKITVTLSDTKSSPNISIADTVNSTDVAKMASSIVTSATYKVQIESVDAGGYIEKMSISR